MEASLSSHPMVKQVAVLVRKEKLVAYVRLASGCTLGVEEDGALREHLGTMIPSYMIPRYGIYDGSSAAACSLFRI